MLGGGGGAGAKDFERKIREGRIKRHGTEIITVL